MNYVLQVLQLLLLLLLCRLSRAVKMLSWCWCSQWCCRCGPQSSSCCLLTLAGTCLQAFVYMHLSTGICIQAFVYRHLSTGICLQAFVYRHLLTGICLQAFVQGPVMHGWLRVLTVASRHAYSYIPRRP